jgi:crossover junction endodeoxyribonuclease RusA
VLSFRVDGLPVPQGSMKHVGNGRLVHSQGAALAVWRATVALAARAQNPKIIEGAVAISLDFYLPKPRTVKRDMPTVPPDTDKLIRAILDSLSGVIFLDDSQVVEIHATKSYGEPGVEIKVGQKIH